MRALRAFLAKTKTEFLYRRDEEGNLILIPFYFPTDIHKKCEYNIEWSRPANIEAEDFIKNNLKLKSRLRKAYESIDRQSKTSTRTR